MSGISPSADYTDRDYASIRLRLQSLLRSAFPTWTDFNVASFGNLLLDLFAFVGDVLGFYQANQAGEAFFPTATQRRNLIALSKLLGYAPPGATPAVASVTISLAAIPSAPVTLPAGATCRTAEITDPVVFQLRAPITFAAGLTPASITTDVENSASFEDVFPSTSLGNQEITLASTPYIDDSATVSAANGVFVQVADFLASGPQDKHFTTNVDNSDRAVIRFGNGINGAIPLGTITVDYRTGGGAAGNVDAGAISKFDGVWTDTLGHLVQVSITNPLQANGGDNRASVEQIRAFAPSTIRVQNRTVSLEDFRINALKVPGVARALMTTSNEDPGIDENAGILYVVPKGGGAPTQLLKDAVLTMVTVTYPCTLTFQVSVQDPVYLPLNISMVVFRSARATKAQAGTAIRAALADFFRISLADGSPNPTIDFGLNYKDASGLSEALIPLDQVFNVVRDLPELRRMSAKPFEFLINGAHDDVAITAREFPTLGTITITDGDDAGAL